MKVIIAGCGRVGAFVASRLSAEGHSVTVIDREPRTLERLGKTFKGTSITGSVFDTGVLEKAGIEDADVFVSATSSDNSNVASATAAKDIYKVPQVIARIYDPSRAEIYRRLGVPTVCAARWASNEILMLVVHADIAREATLGDGEVQLARIPIPRTSVGRTVGEISVPEEVVVVAIVRGAKSFIPSGSTVFQEHDVLEVAVLSAALPKLKRKLGL